LQKIENIKEVMPLLKQQTEIGHHVVHVANIQQGASSSDKLQYINMAFIVHCTSSTGEALSLNCKCHVHVLAIASLVQLSVCKNDTEQELWRK
jgi:hypothetical protein